MKPILFRPLNKIWWALLAIFWLSSLGVRAQVGTLFSPDHYLSYDICTFPWQNEEVVLKDQFLDWTKFTAIGPINLLNPTAKEYNGQFFGINNPRLHYAAYALEFDVTFNIQKKVMVTNQFGNFILDQFQPNQLLVPTLKQDLTPLPGDEDIYARQIRNFADHYLCYEIPPTVIDTKAGLLRDQFRTRPFQELVAKKLCNPVAKMHNDEIFAILHDNAENHLMCFQIDQKLIVRVVSLLNQFGIKKALVTKDDELCVPSTKIELPVDCMDTSPDATGMCNGICADPTQVCMPSPLANTCQCVPNCPPVCQDASPNPDGTCNGICPSGSNCIVNPNGVCECLQPNPCGFNSAGQCGGACPTTTQTCAIITGTNTCGCS